MSWIKRKWQKVKRTYYGAVIVIASTGIFLSLLYFWGRIQPVGEEVLYLFGYFVLAVICGFALFDSAFSRM